MDRILYDVLNDIDEGIIILNEKFQICFWNNCMECITGIKRKEVINNNFYNILPNFNRNYFDMSFDKVLSDGSKMFFSAAMHKGLIDNKENLNLKISRFIKDESTFLLLEFTNVTNQIIQINILKSYVQKLCKMNQKLKEKEKVIKDLAYHDRLTGVANRTLFYKLAKKFLNNAKINNTLICLIFIDIDNFKNINDSYGHEIGDRTIIKVADILKESTKENGLVARYGGDEFLILLHNINDINSYKNIVSRIIKNKNKTVNFNGEKINISLSMGVSFYPNNGDNIDKLIVEADKAMYTAKKRGKNDYNVCDYD